MKSIAIVGMMFLSMGLFAQQSSHVETVKKEKVCAKKCENVQKCDKMVKAPIRQVDMRTSSVRTGNVIGARVHDHKGDSKAKQKHSKSSVPLRKKSAKVDEKM